MKRIYSLTACVLLLTWVMPLWAFATEFAEPTRNSDRIYTVVADSVVVPVQDPKDHLVRPDLRKAEDKDSPPLTAEFQNTFLSRVGLKKNEYLFIFSPSSGNVTRIKTKGLAIGEPNWGESSGQLENINIPFEAEKFSCVDCLAINASSNPIKAEKFKTVEFLEPPANITPELFGFQSSKYDAVKISYSKRPNGHELVVIKTFKKSSDVMCGNGGLATTESGFLHIQDKWLKLFSEDGQMEPLVLSKSVVYGMSSPTVLFGTSVVGDEVLLFDSKGLIFLNKNSASVTPILKANVGVCGC